LLCAALLYVPATQSVQTEAPATEYLPAKQLMQVLATVAPTVVEYSPAKQLMQVLATVAPTVVEYLPAKQLMQVLATVAPTVVEYLPAAQFVQFGAPACEYDPAGHSLQVSLRTTAWRMVP
jgi:hypothetical protein